MKTPKIFAHSTCLLLCVQFAFTLLLMVSPAMAQERNTVQVSFKRDASQLVKIDLLVGQSRLIEFEEDFERVAVSDDKIAELVVPDTPRPRQFILNGKAFGQINVTAWSRKTATEPSRTMVFDVYVQTNLTLIDNQIKILFPKENIQIIQANGSVVISGSVTKPQIAEDAYNIVKAAVGADKVVNLLTKPVLDAVQVELRIRVAEVNRNKLREIGAAYGGRGTGVPTFVSPGGPATFGSYTRTDQGSNIVEGLLVNPGSVMNIFFGGNNQYFIRALEERGAVRTLAEPTVSAMNGKEASFLAGGEFPIPQITSASNGQSGVTITFREFGVKLNFTPTVRDENHIQLELAPEVSAIDFSSGITLQGLVIPGLRTRKAKTTVELRDGQSFALAGLIDNSESYNVAKLPLLGDIPIIGELFKSRRFQKNETELLFLCTAKLVEPLNPDQIPVLPGEPRPRNLTQPATGLPPASPPQSNLLEGESGHAPAKRKPGQ
jgi:pilus assembly protein CpaC